MNNDLPPKLALSILIVNFNGKHLLGPCLDSIREYVSAPHEVIVVDNASTDGSVDFIKANYPDVRVVASPLNIGFAAGNNLAANEASGRYFLMLNSDTVICSSIDPLIALMDARRDAGALGCRLVYENGRQQESVGYLPSSWSLPLSWTPLARLCWWPATLSGTVGADSTLYEQQCAAVGWVSGAFILTRADVWQQMIGLDEKYFMYMEDADFCRRLHDAGFKILYSAACQVIHLEGAGRPWIGERAVLDSTNSYMVYVKKFEGAYGLVKLRFGLTAVFLARSMAHFIAAIFGTDPYGREKARAFRRAALRLYFGRERN
jgi:N-acetylglucosaminyl-diphospho-decaprenol L-rhamnosyltransferase